MASKSSKMAVFVDAGYFFSQVERAVLGCEGEQIKRLRLGRESVQINYDKMRSELLEYAEREFPDSSLLRVYWYDGPGVNGEKSKSHIEIENLDDFKLRLGSITAMREQKEVDGLITVDLLDLSIKKAIGEALLISGDADLAPAMMMAQSQGVRVHLLSLLDTKSTSPVLRREADRKRSMDKGVIEVFAKAATWAVERLAEAQREASRPAAEAVAETQPARSKAAPAASAKPAAPAKTAAAHAAPAQSQKAGEKPAGSFVASPRPAKPQAQASAPAAQPAAAHAAQPAQTQAPQQTATRAPASEAVVLAAEAQAPAQATAQGGAERAAAPVAAEAAVAFTQVHTKAAAQPIAQEAGAATAGKAASASAASAPQAMGLFVMKPAVERTGSAAPALVVAPQAPAQPAKASAPADIPTLPETLAPAATASQASAVPAQAPQAAVSQSTAAPAASGPMTAALLTKLAKGDEPAAATFTELAGASAAEEATSASAGKAATDESEWAVDSQGALERAREAGMKAIETFSWEAITEIAQVERNLPKDADRRVLATGGQMLGRRLSEREKLAGRRGALERAKQLYASRSATGEAVA
jgi:uncharacterized LabA/DUF88 family protein